MTSAANLFPQNLASGKVGKSNYVMNNALEETMQMADLTPETITMTFAGATNSGVYVMDSDLKEPLTVTGDASATITELATALALQWNDNPSYASAGQATASVGVVTVLLGEHATAMNMVQTSGPDVVAIVTTLEVEPTIAYGVPVYQDSDGKATTTRPGAFTVADELIGISKFDLATERPSSAVSQVERTRRMLRVGMTDAIGVVNSDTTAAKRRDAVYIGAGGGTPLEANKFFVTSGADRERIPTNIMRWHDAGTIRITLG